MNNYIQEILRIIRTKNDGMVQSVMIFNKEGILEYYKKGDENLGNFADEVVGKSICDIYENLNETNSTVVKALQTGESSVTNEQRLVYRDFDLIISGTTCPIRDETGDIQGAADIVRTVKVQKQRECSDVCLESDALNRIVTGDDGMVRLKKRISEIAKSDSAVFLYGETGTGKELFAEALHDLGKRRDRPFVTQNCAAIPGSLLESIFFGTEKGSFTGAERKAGLFELADGGTLFLDEVNSMPLDIQAKLLKVIEEQRVRRIGGEKDISFDVRVVAASNEAPSALIDSGRMRSDFYYRIAVVNLTIPPLRERADDLDLLTKYYIDYFNHKMHKNIQGLSQMARDFFHQWCWPGNVRELKNTVENAFNIEKSTLITMDSIPDLIERVALWQQRERGQKKHPGNEHTVCEGNVPERLVTEADKNINQVLSGQRTLSSALQEYERLIIQRAVQQSKTLTAAGRLLGMSPQRLDYHLRKLGLK